MTQATMSLRPSSAVREGEPSKVVPASVAGQDSAYPAQPPSSAEARSKEIGVLAPSAQLNATNEPRNRDDIVAAPGQAEDSEPTPGQQVKLSAPSSYTQRPSGTLEEDEPADNPGEAKSSKPRSVAQEGKASTAVPVSAPDTQYGAAPNQVVVDEQKFALSGIMYFSQNGVLTMGAYSSSLQLTKCNSQHGCLRTKLFILPLTR